MKNSFADGDAGVIKQTLRGAQITFTLNQTSISQYVYLDDSMKISTSQLVKPTSPQPIVGCFAAALKNDRFYLHIVKQIENDVSGKISLRNANKDSLGGFKQLFKKDLAGNIRINPTSESAVNGAIEKGLPIGSGEIESAPRNQSIRNHMC